MRAAFLRIGAAWELQVDQASRLLGLSEVEYALWIETPALTPAILIRLSYLFGIYVDLTRLLPAPGRAARWVRQPNTAAVFAGRTALEYLLERDVAQWAAVRNYLSGQFG
ncbi:MbcA/ParS/Xre antitoxin family protein [Lysobacter soli]|uniref:antitoxin Xre/MbcA/ParS toxin-binding domain-containing protein n=1 Tax=Lysobacter soli TaxID=453783 RepID=UPI00209E0ADC|nr:antitoxin Xre/MbcA/ParS toxin-binding domain-containing protein [Lysobacter soli]UTA55598.1 MbcA/ParS/Xre antitoxin family protein [Lysobacter soli]